MSQTPETGSRWYPQSPMVGVGAVVFKDGKMLMIQRAKEPGKGKWSIPGGMVELGETLYEAARREISEECSIEIEIERVLDASEAIMKDEDGRIKYHFVLVDLLAKYKSGEIRAQSDAGACRWVALDEIDSMDVTQNLVAMLRRAKLI